MTAVRTNERQVTETRTAFDIELRCDRCQLPIGDADDHITVTVQRFGVQRGTTHLHRDLHVQCYRIAIVDHLWLAGLTLA